MTKTRNTLQRDIVLQTILSMRGHATADKIYERIHALHPSISRATVYRNLKMLEGEGKVMRIEVSDGADYFEARTQEHYHIRCARCGKLFDAALPFMPDLVTMEQAADSEFEIYSCNLLFVGFCPECKAKQSAQEHIEQASDK